MLHEAYYNIIYYIHVISAKRILYITYIVYIIYLKFLNSININNYINVGNVFFNVPIIFNISNIMKYMCTYIYSIVQNMTSIKLGIIPYVRIRIYTYVIEQTSQP